MCKAIKSEGLWRALDTLGDRQAVEDMVEHAERGNGTVDGSLKGVVAALRCRVPVKSCQFHAGQSILRRPLPSTDECWLPSGASAASSQIDLVGQTVDTSEREETHPARECSTWATSFGAQSRSAEAILGVVSMFSCGPLALIAPFVIDGR
jgi:hypothetical protein